MSHQCPACGTVMRPGASGCPDCGWVPASSAPRVTGISPAAAASASSRPSAGTQIRDRRCDECKSQSAVGSVVCERCGTALPLVAGTELQGPREKYQLVKHLKSGGFGAVYKATRQRDGHVVAVKEMICTNEAERDIRYELFSREARILQEARSLRIVPLFYDFFEIHRDAYLVLEFIQGADLDRVVQQRKAAFSIDQVVDWAGQVCDVLTWMHTQNPPMVHRDLKPGNIMLLSNGVEIKMIDFGTVRAAGTERPGASGNSQTRFIYTEGYAPLEQIGGKAEPRSDLFALSATVYQLLTNEPPQAHNTPRLDHKLPSCPRWLADLVHINLREDRAERYLSAADFKQDLTQRKVTSTVACSRCNRSNPARTPYCQYCAWPLTENVVKCPSPNCSGPKNIAGSRYCIYCGTPL